VMTRTQIPRRRTAVLAALLSVLTAATPAMPQDERFSEEMTVRETGVVIEMPDALLDNRVPTEELTVLLGGRLTPVRRLERLEDGDWRLVVYVDRVLANPDTLFHSTLALSERSADLARLGGVEVVVADPVPRVVLPASREAKRVREVLADLAGEARLAMSRPRQGPPASSPPDEATLRRQLDRLLTYVTARPASGPHAVFLTADAFRLPPEQVDLLTRGGDAPLTGLAAVLGETSTMLAAYGWVTIPLAIRGDDPGEERSEMSDTERIRQHAGGWGGDFGVPPVIPSRGHKPSTLRFEKVIDLFLLPDYAPLRAFARPTAGTVLGFEEQLGATLAGLRTRWRLWYDAPASVDGQVRPLEVRLRRDVVPRSQRFIRASTPEGIAETRLRLLLGGGTLPDGGLPLRSSLRGTEGGTELRLEVEPFPFTGSPPRGPVRVSLAFADADGRATAIRHETAPPIEGTEKGWRHALPLRPPAGSPKLGVCVEDLARERWSCAALPL
jgi:hypothetical protein